MESYNIDTLWEHIQNGGIVSNGAYTLGKDKYFAFGTYPGCIRGGNVTKESLTKGGGSR